MTKKQKEAYIEKLMKTLDISREEAEEVYETDKIIDRDTKNEVELSFDLPPEEAKAAKKFANVGEKKTKPSAEKKPRTKKVNEVKRQIVSDLFDFLSGYDSLELEGLEVLNPEQKIAFTVTGGKNYTITLTEKRQ